MDSEHRKLCSCQTQSGLTWGGKCNGLATNTSLVLRSAIMKCQQQISFLKLTKTESRNERVTSPGPALPSEACQFIFTLNRDRPCYESLPAWCKLRAIPNGKVASRNDQSVPKEEKQQQIHLHVCSKMDFNSGL